MYDHHTRTGLPSYKGAREAYRLTPVLSFAEMPGEYPATKALLSDAYGADIENLDAFVGAVAEGSSTGSFFGELLQVRLSARGLRHMVACRSVEYQRWEYECWRESTHSINHEKGVCHVGLTYTGWWQCAGASNWRLRNTLRRDLTVAISS